MDVGDLPAMTSPEAINHSSGEQCARNGPRWTALVPGREDLGGKPAREGDGEFISECFHEPPRSPGLGPARVLALPLRGQDRFGSPGDRHTLH